MQQAAFPCLLMAQPSQHPEPATPAANTSVLDLRGGTDAAMAPPVGYVQHVLLPMLHRLQRVDASIHLHRRGFFPKVCGQKIIKRAVNSKSLEARMLLFNLHWARVYVVKTPDILVAYDSIAYVNVTSIFMAVVWRIKS